MPEHIMGGEHESSNHNTMKGNVRTEVTLRRVRLTTVAVEKQ